jgi:NADH:ubiquinone oxidoreductase subunit E
MSAATPAAASSEPWGGRDACDVQGSAAADPAHLPSADDRLVSRREAGSESWVASGRQSSPGDERIDRLIRSQGGRDDALIEVLHQVQELDGFLSKPALLQVARGLQLPLSRVYGVASFYHLFRLQPPAEHRCAVCLGTACFVRGGGALALALQRRLGLELDQSRPDGRWALERVSCVGACGQAPVLLLDGSLLTAPSAAADEVLDGWLTERGLPPALGRP